MANGTEEHQRGLDASFEDEVSSRRTVTNPLSEYDQLKEQTHYITDKNMIAIIDKIGELVRALRKNIRMKINE